MSNVGFKVLDKRRMNKMPKTLKEQGSRTALRLPHDQREEIEQLIKKGKFKSLSQVIREALNQFLEAK